MIRWVKVVMLIIGTGASTKHDEKMFNEFPLDLARLTSWSLYGLSSPVMDGSLPTSLKHIISNAEYYGPSLFLLGEYSTHTTCFRGIYHDMHYNV